MDEQHVQKGWLMMFPWTEVYVSCSHDKIERKLEEKNKYEKGIWTWEKTRRNNKYCVFFPSE